MILIKTICLYFNFLNAEPMWIHDPNLIHIVPVDALAFNDSTRPSANTLLTFGFAINDPKYYNVIMNGIASQITSLMVVYSTVYSRRRSKKHQSSASLAFVRGIHRWPVNSPHKGP